MAVPMADRASAGGDDDATAGGLAATGSAKRSSFVLGKAAPYAGVLPGGQGPFQALHAHLALHADRLGLVDLDRRRSGGSYGKEELGILVLAPRPVNPLHLTTLSVGFPQAVPGTECLGAGQPRATGPKYSEGRRAVTIPVGEFHEGSLIVAHRGASAREPENTLVAFESALAAGADVVELDVRLTKDGVPVVLHDPDVAGTTDGTGFVHQMTLGQVKRLDASGGAGPGQEIPTLAEALDLIGTSRGGANLEIKNLPGEPAFDSPAESVLLAALETVRATRFDGPVLVSSFNWLTIERCKAEAPEVLTGFLTIAPIDPWAALVYARQHGHDFVLPQVPALVAAEERFISDAHDGGVRVGTWVVDEEELLALFFGWGVDAVASNDPALASAVRDRVVGRPGRGRQ
jgi:glycerophosphoryl diester phosphodiesterase